jgi:predicted nucleic acid-binding protein
MKWLLDTNTLSYLLRSDAIVRAHFEETRSDPDHVFVLSPVVDFEFRRYTLLKNATSIQERYEALAQRTNRGQRTIFANIPYVACRMREHCCWLRSGR